MVGIASTTKASTKFKITNTNRLKDFHCGSRNQIQVCPQLHGNFLETIELPETKS
jgi:hypothetical protein